MLSKISGYVRAVDNMNSIFLRYRALIIAFFSSVCLFFWIYSLPTQTEVEISKESIQKIDGYAYFTKIPPIDGIWIKVALGDTNYNPNRSKTKLLENGLEIGIPHTPHQSISTIGNGRFSHWHHLVYFSTTDNSNPATNDIRYSLKITLERPVLLTLFLIALPVTLLLWSIVISTSFSTAMKVAGAVLSILIFTMAAVAICNQYAFLKNNFWPLCLSFDSVGYLASDRIRPPGYPAFLNVVLSAMGNLNNLTLSQFSISTAASIYFGIAVARLFGIIFIGCLSSLILICTTPHMIYGTGMLSEALFIPILTTYFAVLADYLRTNKKIFLCVAGLVLVTLVSVRTLGLAVVPAFILLCLPIHKNLKSIQTKRFSSLPHRIIFSQF